MKKRVPFDQHISHTDAASQMQQGHADISRRGAPIGGRRLTDLFGIGLNSPELLEDLRHIHWSARQVIGDNLGRHSLERTTLERLEASVLRQAGHAGDLQDRFLEAGAGSTLQGEIAALQAFLDSALAEIGQQLKPAH
jgi:hypothetical protein